MRVLIVTASMGAGHTEVAAELAGRLSARGAEVRVVDLLALAGSAGARLRRAYRVLLRWAPWLYDAAMRFWARWPGPLEALTAAGAHRFERALADAVGDGAPDVIVSTYDLASQALGRLAGRGEITAPVVTYVCDPGAHPYWIGAHVDTHLVLTPLTAADLRGYGARGVSVVRPVLRPEFGAPPPRDRARRRVQLPVGAPVVLVAAGSWAVGGIARTARQLAAAADLIVVVLCGRDRRVRRRLRGVPGVTAVGWTAQMSDYLAAADVVVDNAGGLTCWEALACGTPVLLFRPLPGHGRINAATLHRAGLAHLVRRGRDLPAAVLAALGSAGHLPDVDGAGDAVELILRVAAGRGAAPGVGR